VASHRPASLKFELRPVPPFRLDLTVWALRRRPRNLVDRWDGTTYRRVIIIAQLGVSPPSAAVEFYGGTVQRLHRRFGTFGVDAPDFRAIVDRMPPKAGPYEFGAWIFATLTNVTRPSGGATNLETNCTAR
jgi:hypothetical protein